LTETLKCEATIATSNEVVPCSELELESTLLELDSTELELDSATAPFAPTTVIVPFLVAFVVAPVVVTVKLYAPTAAF
jgi:hypothetical protein